jgi:hypothetical protein
MMKIVWSYAVFWFNKQNEFEEKKIFHTCRKMPEKNSTSTRTVSLKREKAAKPGD